MSVSSVHATVAYLAELFPHYRVYDGIEDNRRVVYISNPMERFMAVLRNDGQLATIVRTVSKW